MKPSSEQCHTSSVDQFLDGTLAPSEMAQFEQHLSTCRDCEQLLTLRTADATFWNDAKEFLSSDMNDQRPSTAIDQTIHDLSGLLDPTDDPQMLGRFAGYEITGIVGRGGMGIVMKGRDVSLDRFVAIKVLSPHYGSNSAARKRFAREAQAAAAVVHDNVIPIYGVAQWNQLPFLVMPYVKGESLQQRIDRTAPIPVEDLLGISLQIARGLSAAHDQGLVHRDIKPANILMPSSVSRVIITDFGLARAADDASCTRSGVIAGTPQYMSPEQAKGEPVDGRTDLFSLGSVMYAMACGHPPFRSDTVYGILRRITDHPHRPITQVRADIPVWLESIIDQLLQKEPSARFASAHALAEHLEVCLAHLRQPTSTTLPKIEPVGTSDSLPTSHGIRRWFSFAAVFAAIAAICLFWFDWPNLTSRSNTEALSNAELIDANLNWQYDDSELVRLESELEQLKQELGDTPFSIDSVLTQE
ncbi:Serine/threonine-protein kinase PrkC [Planctomycetes bacterium CA13]|uniref:non-specific serine/threonine protein kinase n=1 Tax=Novipirellula herctigrandis TaxID=2527986 RepID=A0A5C5Z7G3_9BACT|nr:Serine/threonine-protein kinase PrkC [Planctomycetes bacterium CA13]